MRLKGTDIISNFSGKVNNQIVAKFNKYFDQVFKDWTNIKILNNDVLNKYPDFFTTLPKGYFTVIFSVANDSFYDPISTEESKVIITIVNMFEGSNELSEAIVQFPGHFMFKYKGMGYTTKVFPGSEVLSSSELLPEIL